MKNFSSKNKFPQSPKSAKKHSSRYKEVPNKMAADLSQILSKISDMSTIRILIYTVDKYTLQTKIVSFLYHEKSLKEVDSG